ncbi:MAG TPA: sensor histidine kinase [Synergistaceae bacterium]|jgi:signal transduction histidine kinase|nr:sensor histidine kinase [Synergistaceae bacterium]
MRRHLLTIISLAILLPAFAVLFVSGVSLMQHERAMKAVARSYVQEMADNVASRLVDVESRRWGRDYPSIEVRNFRIFTWGPSVPGWVAVINSQGRILFSSPGVDKLAEIWQSGIPLGRAVEIKDKQGSLYTVAVYPVSGGERLVVAAVAWENLLGPLARIGRVWAILVAFMAISILIALLALWKWFLMPIRGLVGEIDTLHWGKDLPRPSDPRAALEIGSLREVLYKLARTAVERTSLQNRYVSDIVRAQEGEKSRIARELHDGTIQNVTAMIQQVRLSRMDTADRVKHLALAEETAHVVVRDLREMCDDLSPPWIDLGLSQAMTELADRLARHYSITITMDVDDNLDLTNDEILAFFRIFQEGVSNAVRHGKATAIHGEIVLKEDRSVVFEFRDNGAGFDPHLDYESLRVAGHRGLANMLERMMLAGGRLEIFSKLGEGTSVRCTLPPKDAESA